MSGPYPDRLLELARRPADTAEIQGPRRHGEATNPLCGDEVAVDVSTVGGRVAELAHRSRGCAFVRASAAALWDEVPGLTLAEAAALAEAVRHALTDGGELPQGLEVLGSVRAFPARVRCATLPWEALEAALSG